MAVAGSKYLAVSSAKEMGDPAVGVMESPKWYKEGAIYSSRDPKMGVIFLVSFLSFSLEEGVVLWTEPLPAPQADCESRQARPTRSHSCFPLSLPSTLEALSVCGCGEGTGTVAPASRFLPYRWS